MLLTLRRVLTLALVLVALLGLAGLLPHSHSQGVDEHHCAACILSAGRAGIWLPPVALPTLTPHYQVLSTEAPCAHSLDPAWSYPSRGPPVTL